MTSARLWKKLATELRFSLIDNLISNQRDYIEWLLNACMAEGTQIPDSLEVAAIDLLATRLKTPPNRTTFKTGVRGGVPRWRKPVTAAMESILLKDMNELANPDSAWL